MKSYLKEIRSITFHDKYIAQYMYMYIYIYISTCRFNSLQSLITHIRNDHNVLVDIKTIQFEDFQSFLSWKEEEEFNTISQHEQQCAPK